MWGINLPRFLRSRLSELSRHAVPVAGLCGIFFAFVDFMDSVNNGRFTVSWSVYVSLLVCLITFFWIEVPVRSHDKLIIWCLLLLLAPVLHRLSIYYSVTSPERNLYTFFLSTFASSIMCLLAFHYIISKLALQKIFSFKARKQPDIWATLSTSAVVSVACCVLLSQCREAPLEQRYWKAKFCSYSPKLARSESPAGSSEEMYLGLSPWATLFIGVYVVSYVVESMTMKSGDQQNTPDFLPMANWYSGTSLDLYKTVFDMVSTYVIQTRFDMRILQAALNQREEATRDNVYDHFWEKEELWFDFMADTGDGGDSTYTVARLLARPEIRATDPNPSAKPNQRTNPEPGAQNNNPDEQSSNTNQDPEPKLDLKRGNLLLIGGDLAYPNPSGFTYERRLFRPFQYALQPPPPKHDALQPPPKPAKHDERMTTNKPKVPPEMPEDIPQCFVIPGNHGWS